jgi:hypothetical protein
MTTPAEELAAQMLKPQSISNDGVSVSNRSLSELMEYEKHQAAKAAVASPVAFFKKSILKIVPPGGH